MRLATIRVHDGVTRAAVHRGSDWILLGALDIGQLIASDDWRSRAQRALTDRKSIRIPISHAELLRPVAKPTKIVCCGLNYRDHIAETGRDVPAYPTLFAKFSDTLADPEAAIVVQGSEKVDWEAELAVIVGADAHRLDPEEAGAAILGYTVANDISMRDWQARTLQWFQGKAWDGTTPVGPSIVTSDEISPADGLVIRASIGEELVQHSNTRELVFDGAHLVSYVSQFTRLSPGDMILTGTPGGVGMGRTPQRWLADGDLLTTSIEGIGEIRNTIRIVPENLSRPEIRR